MILIRKNIKPDILVTNDIIWTHSYMTYVNDNQAAPDNVMGHYRHPEIRASIENETNSKCAYCESLIKPASFGDVEHILPKKKYPKNIFQWENLTLACEVCNRKYKKEHDNPPLINPYINNPSDHLLSEGPMIISKPNNIMGEVTVTIMGLNRNDLLLRRAEKINSLLSLLNRWESETNPALKEILKIQLCQEADNSKEYSFIVKSFLERMGVIP